MQEPTETLRAQGAAYAALTALVDAHPALPRPYLTVSSAYAVEIGLQLGSPVAFEQWRAALGIAPSTVALFSYGGSVWLAAEGEYLGVPVQIRGFGLALPEPVEVCHDAELRAGHPEAAHELDAADAAFVVLAPGRPEVSR